MSGYGKFFIHRNIFESDIWEKPPYFLKIWVWIIGRANFKRVKKGGQIYERGEFLTSIPKIIEANKWMVGWRTERLTEDQAWRVLEFLRKTERITTRKTTRGLWIKVLNYDYYQTLPRHEANNEPHSETNKGATADQHYKRKKEKKEKKLSTVSPSSTSSPTSEIGQEGKGRDPKVKEVIDYFCETCENIKGFKPRVNYAVESKMIKQYLKDYSVDELTDELCWFLESKESDRLGCTIKVALSVWVFNKWLASREY